VSAVYTTLSNYPANPVYDWVRGYASTGLQPTTAFVLKCVSQGWDKFNIEDDLLFSMVPPVPYEITYDGFQKFACPDQLILDQANDAQLPIPPNLANCSYFQCCYKFWPRVVTPINFKFEIKYFSLVWDVPDNNRVLLWRHPFCDLWDTVENVIEQYSATFSITYERRLKGHGACCQAEYASEFSSGNPGSPLYCGPNAVIPSPECGDIPKIDREIGSDCVHYVRMPEGYLSACNDQISGGIWSSHAQSFCDQRVRPFVKGHQGLVERVSNPGSTSTCGAAGTCLGHLFDHLGRPYICDDFVNEARDWFCTTECFGEISIGDVGTLGDKDNNACFILSNEAGSTVSLGDYGRESQRKQKVRSDTGKYSIPRGYQITISNLPSLAKIPRNLFPYHPSFPSCGLAPGGFSYYDVVSLVDLSQFNGTYFIDATESGCPSETYIETISGQLTEFFCVSFPFNQSCAVVQKDFAPIDIKLTLYLPPLFNYVVDFSVQHPAAGSFGNFSSISDVIYVTEVDGVATSIPLIYVRAFQQLRCDASSRSYADADCLRIIDYAFSMFFCTPNPNPFMTFTINPVF